MTGRSHLSIGEVLSLLQQEFPDVTISKIRFLESQGLVDPERTPSGYRKFYEPDIERLRWVLRQQRDAFLPLKVIKGRLEGRPEPVDDQPRLSGLEDVGKERAAPSAERARGRPGTLTAGRPDEPGDAEGPYEAPGGGPSGLGPVAAGRRKGPRGNGNGRAAQDGPRAMPARGPAEQRAPVAGDRLFDAGASAGRGPLPLPPASTVATTQRHPSRAGLRGGTVRDLPPPGPVDGPGPDELTLDELLASAGVDLETVRDLERFGLVAPKVMGSVAYYRAEAVEVARVAAAFARHGVEARHLRAYKGAAEREAGLVQQVVMPLIRQRNPDARRAAADMAQELSQLGGELRTALLRSALSDLR